MGACDMEESAWVFMGAVERRSSIRVGRTDEVAFEDLLVERAGGKLICKFVIDDGGPKRTDAGCESVGEALARRAAVCTDSDSLRAGRCL